MINAIDPLLISGSVLITLALLFYSCGVWGEKIQGRLNKLHVVFFWAGVICDTLGTTAMMMMLETITLDFHNLTGIIAIILMIIHAIWATIVLMRNRENELINFHKYSLVVWFIWLVPYFSGVVMGMSQ